MTLQQSATVAEARGVPASGALDGFYNDKVVRQFAVATVVWGIVGMAVGAFIAAQLYWPKLGEASRGSATAACARCTPMQ